MKTTALFSTALFSTAVISPLAPAARAELLVYEPFSYSPGTSILTPLNGGTGFAEAWRRAEEGSNDSITVATGAPGTGNLDGVFNNVAVTTTPAGSGNLYIDGAVGDDRITANRVLSQGAGALAGADKVLWASVVWTMNGSNFGRQVGFVLGTDGLSNRSQNISTNTSWGGSGAGDAIGVGGAINTQSATPTIWDGGSQVVRTTTGAKDLFTNQDNIVILKFVFADGATPDTVHAWAFGETETITEAAFNANAISASAVIDQDTLDVLSFGQSQVDVETIDEIRLGDTFTDVTSGVIEPPVELPFQITEINYNPGSDETTLTWNSVPGEFYGVYWSPDLATFYPGIHPAVPAHATEGQTTYGPFPNPVPNADRLFFRIGPPDLVDPELLTTWGTGSSITLTFSEAMFAQWASDPANFSLVKNGSTPVAVTGATVSPEGTTITLTLGEALGSGTSYTVTIDNLTDLAGRALGNGTVGGFQTYDNFAEGIQVFILAGQSNMVGHGKTEIGRNPSDVNDTNFPGGLGSLRYMAVNDIDGVAPHYRDLLVDPNQPATSAWLTRSDVKVWWRDSDIGDTRAVIKGDLKIGYSQSRNPEWIGPEFGFGWAVGDHFADKPVLIIKCAWGGKSLHVDFRPPGAVAARSGVVGPYYAGMIEYVRDCLSNLESEFPAAQNPEFAAAGYRYRIAGFGWHQGWNDRAGPAIYSEDYEENLVDLIDDLRAEFAQPGLPFSITTTGMAAGPVESYPYTGYSLVEKAQLAVGDPVLYPGFAATVRSTDARPFYRDYTISPSNFGYHWNHNGESQYLNGTAMGEKMVELLPP